MVYKPGATNPADTLSRPPSKVLAALGNRETHHRDVASEVSLVWSSLVELPVSWKCLAVSTPRPSRQLNEKLFTTPTQMFTELFRAGYKVDPWYSESANWKKLQEKDGLYYTTTGRLAVPASVVPLVQQECHDQPYSGHFGVKKTLKTVERSYWWPQWREAVVKYVSTCASCQRVKAVQKKPGGLLQSLPTPDAPWESVSMDFIVELTETESGKNAIFVLVDRFSKMVHLIPCTTTCTAEEAAELFLSNIYRLHGMPKELICDRDTRWTSQFWKQLCESLNVQIKMSSAFHPQTDGQTERVNRVLEDTLRHFVSPRKNDWDKLLPAVEFALNSAYHESTRTTPFELNYGFKPSSPFDVALGRAKLKCEAAQNLRVRLHEAIKKAKQCMQAAKDRQKKFADKKRTDVRYEEGQQVLLSTKNLHIPSAGNKKLLPRYVGPFKILKVINDVAVKLELPEHMKCHNVFHVSLIKTWNPETRDPKPPEPVMVEGHLEYVVQKVLQHRIKKLSKGRTKVYYLVKCLKKVPKG